MDVEALKKMTVAELREEAKKIPDAKGLSAMKKDELVEFIASHAGDSTPAPAAKAAKPAKKDVAKAVATTGPLDKAGIKQRISALKAEKQEALSSQDKAKAHSCNRQIHHYKHLLRKMASAKQATGK